MNRNALILAGEALEAKLREQSFEGELYRKIRALMGYQLDRRDAQLMLSLTQYQAHMPDGVAVAHRMVRGASGEAAGMFINGLWVNLA